MISAVPEPEPPETDPEQELEALEVELLLEAIHRRYQYDFRDYAPASLRRRLWRRAQAEGLRIRYSKRGFVYENEPPDRATFRYQLYRFYWEGNSSYVTSVRSGVPRWRMFVHGLASLVRAVARPFGRVWRGETPQLRFAFASVLNAVGKLVGVLGVRVAHH